MQFRHCHLTFIGFVIVEKKECSIKHAQISGVQTAVRCNAANSTTHRGPLSFIVRRVEERERERISRAGYKFHGAQRDSSVYRGDRSCSTTWIRMESWLVDAIKGCYFAPALYSDTARIQRLGNARDRNIEIQQYFSLSNHLSSRLICFWAGF